MTERDDERQGMIRELERAGYRISVPPKFQSLEQRRAEAGRILDTLSGAVGLDLDLRGIEGALRALPRVVREALERIESGDDEPVDNRSSLGGGRHWDIRPRVAEWSWTPPGPSEGADTL